MKAIKFSAIGKAEIVEISQPAPAAKQVRVRVKSAGICHSDIMAFNGQHPYRVPPVITGHEASGVIEALGEGVTDVHVGDRVALEPHQGCGQCEFCRQGHYQVCLDKKLIGVGAWTGVFAEYVVAGEPMCHKIPAGMSHDTGAMIEPYCVGLHAVRRAGITSGDSVSILGCGTIGMMTLLSVMQYDPSNVFVTDLSAAKRDLAVSLGADSAADPTEKDPVEFVHNATGGKGVDTVFVTAPNKATLNQALRMCKRRSTVILIATIPGDTEITTAEIQLHERMIMGSAMYNHKDYEIAIEQWQENRLEGFEKLVSNRITIADAPEMISELARGDRAEDIKNIINFD
ncbi:MAG: alcohol dehydrogenase catalytic domain-containing protein [Desulfobacterales bacterium]|jgi:L-iditol 2-dehydrogenase